VLLPHGGHAQEQFLQAGHVALGRGAEAVEERERTQRGIRHVGVAVGQRRDADLDVLHDLDRRAAGGAGHDRADEHVVDDADEHLHAAGRDHPLGEELLDLRALRGDARGHFDA